jgi:hypothetical protein
MKKEGKKDIGGARRGGLPQKAWKVRKLFRVRFRYTAPKGRLTRRKPSPKTVASLPKPFRNGFSALLFARLRPTDRARNAVVLARLGFIIGSGKMVGGGAELPPRFAFPRGWQTTESREYDKTGRATGFALVTRAKSRRHRNRHRRPPTRPPRLLLVPPRGRLRSVCGEGGSWTRLCQHQSRPVARVFFNAPAAMKLPVTSTYAPVPR